MTAPQVTAGQSAPIAANGGRSYMAFNRNGDGGTVQALYDALVSVGEGKSRRVARLIEQATAELYFRSLARCYRTDGCSERRQRSLILTQLEKGLLVYMRPVNREPKDPQDPSRTLAGTLRDPVQHFDQVERPELNRGTTAGENRLNVSITVRMRSFDPVAIWSWTKSTSCRRRSMDVSKLERIARSIAAAHTFQGVAEEWLERSRRKSWRNHAQESDMASGTNLPGLWKTADSAIKALELLPVLKEVEASKRDDTVNRIRSTYPAKNWGTKRPPVSCSGMSDPISLNIPHKLGRAAARERLENGIGQLAAAIPGGSLVEHHWDGDRLSLVLQAMGQRVSARLEVLDTAVHAIIDLPPFAALFAHTVKSHIEAAGTKLLC